MVAADGPGTENQCVCVRVDADQRDCVSSQVSSRFWVKFWFSFSKLPRRTLLAVDMSTHTFSFVPSVQRW